MANAVEKLLRQMRIEKIRQQNVRLPKKRLPEPRILEVRYNAILRNYQKQVNNFTYEAIKPIIDSFRQDATTAQIEAIADELERAIFGTIDRGQEVHSAIVNQGQQIAKWNDKKYTSHPIYEIMGFNAVPADGVSEMVQSWTVENIKLVKGINEDQVKKVETLLLRASREQAKPGLLTREIRKIFKTSLNRATLIARDQVLKLNGQIDRYKQTEAGITHFIWRTSRDDRVRPQHRSREGKKYAWNNPPNGELPGQPVRCRCTAEPSFEEMLGPAYKVAA